MTGSDIIEAAREQAGHADYRTGMDVFWDLRDARFVVDHEEIFELAEALSSLPLREVPHKTAVVAFYRGTRDLTRTLGRIGPDHPVEYKAFSSRDEALDWLGLPRDFDVSV